MRKAEDRLAVTDAHIERTANTRKYENSDETKRSVALITRICERKKQAGNWKFTYVAEGTLKPEKLLLMFVEGSALSVDPKWDECHEVCHPLSDHHLHRPSDDMKLPKFLRLPKIHGRARSKTRSEIGPIGDQSGADLTIPRPGTESTPNLQIGTSNLPTPSPLTSRDQESNSM